MKAKITARFLIFSMLLSSMFVFPVSAAETSESREVELIEYDAETEKETVFTLDDVLKNDAKRTNVAEVVREDRSSYTLPYDPETGYELPSSNDDSNSAKSVFDDKPLEPVSNVKEKPYCKTVLIVAEFEYEDGSVRTQVGSGAMVGNKVVLTAGHVVYDENKKRMPKHVRVYQRFDKEISSLSELMMESGYFNAQRWVFAAPFTETGDDNYDWCYLTMYDDIGKTYTGWFGIEIKKNTIFKYNVNLTGYPGSSGKTYKQYKSNGKMKQLSDYRFKHYCSAENGHSGSPLYSDSYIVWGVHTHGFGSDSYNKGVRITQFLYDLLVNKINETN